MITQPFLFQLFAAEEPLTGRLQEITPQVHSESVFIEKDDKFSFGSSIVESTHLHTAECRPLQV